MTLKWERPGSPRFCPEGTQRSMGAPGLRHPPLKWGFWKMPWEGQLLATAPLGMQSSLCLWVSEVAPRGENGTGAKLRLFPERAGGRTGTRCRTPHPRAGGISAPTGEGREEKPVTVQFFLRASPGTRQDCVGVQDPGRCSPGEPGPAPTPQRLVCCHVTAALLPSLSGCSQDPRVSFSCLLFLISFCLFSRQTRQGHPGTRALPNQNKEGPPSGGWQPRPQVLRLCLSLRAAADSGYWDPGKFCGPRRAHVLLQLRVGVLL